jgi:putative endopeptidase
MLQPMGSKAGVIAMLTGVLALPLAIQSDPARPMYGAWGYDTAGADHSTRPGDDFFRYANGGWLDRTAIPADKPS